LSPNQWHHLQLVLDLKDRTISGDLSAGLARRPNFIGKPFFLSQVGPVVIDSVEPELANPGQVENWAPAPAIRSRQPLGFQDLPIPPVSTDPPSLGRGTE
jgi:hypothetical protein